MEPTGSAGHVVRVGGTPTGRRIVLLMLALIALAVAVGLPWFSLSLGEDGVSAQLLIVPVMALLLVWMLVRLAFFSARVEVGPAGVSIGPGRRAFIAWPEIQAIWLESDSLNEVLRVVPADRSAIRAKVATWPTINRKGYGFDLCPVSPTRRTALLEALHRYAADALGAPISAVRTNPATVPPAHRRRVVAPRRDFPGYSSSARTGVIVLGFLAVAALSSGITGLLGVDTQQPMSGVLIGLNAFLVAVGLVTAYLAFLTACVPRLYLGPEQIVVRAYWRTSRIPWSLVAEVLPPTLRGIDVRARDIDRWPRGRFPSGSPRVGRRGGVVRLARGELQVGLDELRDAFTAAAHDAGRADAVAGFQDDR